MSAVTTTKTISATSAWEDLRKRARQLEYEIDAKLIHLNKLGVGLGTQHTRFDLNYAASSSSDKAPLLSPQSTFDTLASELDVVITKLSEVNDQMSDFVHSQQGSQLSQNSAVQHTLRRHRDILRDYSTEFTRARANIQAQLDRLELLDDGAADDSLKANGLNNRRQDGFLKEHEHIRSSDRLLDEQINIAMLTKEKLSGQKMGLREITKKIQTMTKRYPAINSLMQKIQLKKRKDTLVIAGVITVCLILLFLYASR